jgi:lipopolysaccharide/colanic/teichoic acid biosynthesis glycosyltransferase
LKKSASDPFYYRFSLRSRAVAASVRNGVPPVRLKKPKQYVILPHLEKIGGMDAAVRQFVSQFAVPGAPTTHILRTSVPESIVQLKGRTEHLVNLKRLNDIKEINRLFSNINQVLPSSGLFIGCVETKRLRVQRLHRKYPVGFSHLYVAGDYVFKRVFPKLPVTRNLYYSITGGRNRVMSKTEVLGRLYAAGFAIRRKELINGLLYFAAEKVSAPLYDYEPVYGPIFKMKRCGKNGKPIYVYKMRTMYSYSEHIQHYVYEKNNLAAGGKMKNDFRVSTLGKLFRKYWIDELPMLINLLKGDVKLVGVRPLSEHYLSLYSEELKNKRLRFRPGLIPPFYVDLPKTLDEIMASEMKYLEAYEKHPVLTDVRYFFKAFYNIVFRQARSK